MRVVLLAIISLLFISNLAFAGSVTITYKNDAGTTLFNPSATISNSDATKFLTWCQTTYAANPLSVTQSGCFNIWANDWFNQMKASVNKNLQDAAASSAASGATIIVVTPQQ